MQHIPILVTAFLLGLLLFQHSNAQQLVPVAPDKYRDLTIPFDEKLVARHFGPAAPPVGETIFFSSKGPVIFHIWRVTIPHGGVVRVTAKTTDGNLFGQWEDKVESFNSYLKRFNVEPGKEAVIGVQVIDDAAGGPSQTPPYTLIIEAWPVSENGSLSVNEQTTIREIARNPKGECRVSMDLGPKPEFIETLDTIDRGDSTRPLQLIRIVTAGSLLGIEIPPSWATHSTPVTVNLYAKDVNDFTFTRICTDLHISPNDPLQMIVGRAFASDYSIWRIEVSAPPNAVIDSSAKQLRLLRTRALASPSDLISISDEWRHGVGLLCFNKILDKERIFEVPTPTSFSGKSKLIIGFGKFKTLLSRQQREQLDKIVLQSVYLWVRACLVCRLDTLIVVTIDNRTFVHPGLYGPFGSSGPFKTTVIGGIGIDGKKFTPGADETDRLLYNGLRGGRIGLGALKPYEEVKRPLREEFAYICQLIPDIERHRTLSAIQQTICQDSSDSNSTATILVRFRDGKTYCGDDPNIIACRADHELTEFNVRDYRFRLTGKFLNQIGNGPVEVDFLHALVHEMGHWIGMEHVNQGESIMASSLEQSRCINFDTVMALVEQIYSSRPVETKPSPFLYRRDPTINNITSNPNL